jgi:hypothetical protein
MNAKSCTVSVAFLLLLGGCAIYPVVPRWSADEIKTASTADPYLAANPEEALEKVQGVRSLLAAAAENKKRTELVASEVTYYGTLIGVAGLSLDKQGLINTGGGAAGLGTLFTGRYRLSEQAVAFRKAEGRVACIEEAITDTRYLDATAGAHNFATASAFSSVSARFQSDPASLALRIAITGRNAEIPAVTSFALRRVASDLRIALNGLALTPLTKEQMKKVLDDAVGKKEAANSTLMQIMGNDSVAGASLISAAAATLSYKEQVEACFVQHPQ